MSGLPGGIDFDDGPRRGPGGGTALLIAGAVVLVAGVLALAYGIGNAVGQAGAIADEAVASGRVGQELAFESPAGEKLTVYLEVESSNSNFKDSVSAGTDCVVRADGFKDSFSGSRQGVATTLGRFVSVGSFTPPGGSGRIRCSGSGVPFLVTPGGGAGVAAAVGIIIGGVAVAGLGGWAVAVGWLRRRRSARHEALGAEQVQ